MIIYITTNLINNKIYIGQDSKHNPDYIGSGKKIMRAIKKYGKKNFVKFLLEVVDPEILSQNPDYGWEREEYWIQYFNARNRNIGYNIAKAARNFWQGHKHSEKSKKKISSSNSGKNSVWFGKKHTKQTLKKLSDSHKNQIPWNKGKELSLEFRKKIQLSRQKKVYQYDLNENLLNEYDSCLIAAKENKIISPSNIGLCCRTKRGTVSGYIWRYEKIK